MKTAKHKITSPQTTVIKIQDSATDKVVTDATLRGIRHLDYNQRIQQACTDKETIQELQRRQGLISPQMIKEMENKIATLESNARDYIQEVGFNWADDADYAITILVERLPR